MTMAALDSELGGGAAHASGAKWQVWALAIVVLGCLATVGYTVVEIFWG